MYTTKKELKYNKVSLVRSVKHRALTMKKLLGGTIAGVH